MSKNLPEPSGEDNPVEDALNQGRRSIASLKKANRQDLFILFSFFFAPVIGPIYFIFFEKMIEEDSGDFLSFRLYIAVYSIVCFFFGFTSLLSKAVGSLKSSTRQFKIFSAIFLSVVTAILLNFSLADFDYISGVRKDKVSWGEESLFNITNAENIIFENNESALKETPGIFRRPFKIGVSMPISHRNLVYNSEEVLKGVAIAQQEWNKNNEKQMAVVIGDDGYTNSEDEFIKAKDTAKELIKKHKDLLAVIGHFTSDSTYVSQEIYSNENITLVSPVSTAPRCDVFPDGEYQKIAQIKQPQDIVPDDYSDDCLSFDRHVFRTALSDDRAIDKVLFYLATERDDIEKIVIIHESNSLYSELYKRTFVEALEDSRYKNKITILNANSTSCDARELERFNVVNCFEKEIDTDDPPQALLLIPSTKNNVWVEKVLEKNKLEGNLNGGKYLILGADSMYQQGFIQINEKPRPETEGMLIPLSWHRRYLLDENVCTVSSDELECKAAKVFSKTEKREEDKFPPDGINWRTFTAYEAAVALFTEIDDVSRECRWSWLAGGRGNCVRQKLVENLTVPNSDSVLVTVQDGNFVNILDAS